MQKDESYHKSAVQYNVGLAEAADALAENLEHPEVQRWCRSVAKQHRFHAGRHQKALNKLNEENEMNDTSQAEPAANITPNDLRREQGMTTDTEQEEGIVVTTYGGQPLEKVEKDLEGSTHEVKYRDAETGEYVSEEYAADHPDTTVSETEDETHVTDVDDVQTTDAQPIEVGPDPSMAAQPIESAPNPEQTDDSTPAGVETEPVELSEEEAQRRFEEAQAEAAAAKKGDSV